AISALVVLDDHVDRGVVETLLTSSSQLDVADFVDLARHEPATDGAGDVLVVACAKLTDAVVSYLGAARRLHPARPALLVCPGALNGQRAEVIGAGADDVLTLPPDSDLDTARAMSAELVFSIRKALARTAGGQTPAGRKLGRMICVLGLKGGSGKTLTAAN